MIRRILPFIGFVVALLPGAVPAAVTTDTGIDYPSIWRCDAAKFNWYCEEEPEPEVERAPRPEKQPKTEEEQALEELERLRKMLEAKKALAIMNPSPENVAAYITAQEALMNRASLFSDVWRRVVWQHPELNYELKRPVNNAAIATHTGTRKAAETKTLDEINKEWGVFFIFRSGCPYCHRLAPTLKFLSETYGITVFPVSTDGGGLPEYPNPQRDNGLVEKLSVKQVPMLVLGNIKDKRLIPLGSGVISAQDVIERIYVLTQTKPGELY